MYEKLLKLGEDVEIVLFVVVLPAAMLLFAAATVINAIGGML